MGRLDDKVALITGGGGSIGAATARLFADEGAKVVLADLDEEGLAVVTDEIGAEIGRASCRERVCSVV